ncbi:tyrosine-type recombinase/integrase [Sulfitobacter guttiformis]|jgi:integrase|uniref:Integrase n=1 Tax=Sulfitobacter guttiformis TaxID=74349 RepID=A0A420DPK8_9RHOB|nr:site-specific integrase [Sulfitobacter guttiformis]KIN73564.1 putative phage integrase [Sulfitobacter guttiformis KCTC 32187]RKE96211.1 integrase [Sulfitobacter guttiformis]
MNGSNFDEKTSGKIRGPHFEKRLKATFVRVAPPGRHTDGGGLYLQVDKSGARRWLLRITVAGRRRDYGLGSANVVTLAEARSTAIELRRVAALGGSPKAHTRAGVGKDMTFETMARRVHERKFGDRVNNGKHIAQWIRTLETYAFPKIGKMSVEEIRQDDIEYILNPIWTEKAETARRVLQRISTVFDHACGSGFRTSGNPANGLSGLMRDQRDRPKNFTALGYHEVPKLWATLSKSESIGAMALRFTILTALRSGSVRKATWDQFDEYLSVWTIPETNMKGREEFKVPLPEQARDILRALSERRSKAVNLVFPSPMNPQKPISDATMRKLLQSHYPGVTVHGMRAAFRTWAAEIVDARDDIAETALAHLVGSSTVRAYKRTEHFYQREILMEDWALWVEGRIELFSNDATDDDRREAVMRMRIGDAEFERVFAGGEPDSL